jgi:hypothetical protein
MTDTQLHIYKIQYDIIASKSMSERVSLGIETIDSVRAMIKRSILSLNPSIDNATLEMQIFLRYYANDFAPELLSKIAQSIYKYHNELDEVN